MAFWAVTCRGSGSNRDLGASTGPMLLSKRSDRIKERTELSAGNVFRSQRLLVYYFCFNAREQFQFQTHHYSKQILWSYPDYSEGKNMMFLMLKRITLSFLWSIITSSPHLFVLLFSSLLPCWVWGVASGVRQALSPGARRQGQRGNQRWLYFAEDLGAKAKAVGELPEAQGLQVTRQSCHHAQQQLRKMLCLDLYVGLLDMLEIHKSSENLRCNYRVPGGSWTWSWINIIIELRLLSELRLMLE